MDASGENAWETHCSSLPFGGRPIKSIVWLLRQTGLKQHAAEDSLELLIRLPLSTLSPQPRVQGLEIGCTATLVYVMLGMEPRDSCILDKHSTNWATRPQDNGFNQVIQETFTE